MYCIRATGSIFYDFFYQSSTGTQIIEFGTSSQNNHFDSILLKTLWNYGRNPFLGICQKLIKTASLKTGLFVIQMTRIPLTKIIKNDPLDKAIDFSICDNTSVRFSKKRSPTLNFEELDKSNVVLCSVVFVVLSQKSDIFNNLQCTTVCTSAGSGAKSRKKNDEPKLRGSMDYGKCRASTLISKTLILSIAVL